MLAYIFIVLAVVVRLIPHPFTFTPVAAALLYFGAYKSRRQIWIPLTLLVGADVYLTLFHYGYPLMWDQVVSWAWYAGILLFGGTLRNDARPLRVLGASLAAALSFFILSNFAVWAAYSMYPHTLSGLTASYIAGIPFFRNELVSDVLFSAVFFGLPVLSSRISGWQAQRSTAA